MSRRTTAVVVAVLALAGACTGRRYEVLPPPPTTIALPPTTTVPDFSSVAIRAVTGKTTTTVAITPGKANITGTVVGPGGPVPGAVVHVERLVDDAVGSVDVLTNPDGTFAVNGILGGRYRVRAFKPAPDNLALVKPELFFLSGADTHQSNLTLDLYSGINAAAAIAPNPPVAGEQANVLVLVTQRSVDGKGIVRAEPVPSTSIELFGTGQWQVLSQNLQSTDAGGRARWVVQCGASGQQPLSVVVGDNQSFPVYTGNCAEPATTTTSSTSSTTSSTVLRPSSTTTSTTTGRTTTTKG